jgi:hypothetical protein
MTRELNEESLERWRAVWVSTNKALARRQRGLH